MSIFKRVSASFKNLSAESMSSSRSGGGSPQSVWEAYRAGDYQLALKKADSLARNTVDYHFLRGTMLYKLGSLEESITMLDQAATISGDDDRQLAKIYHALGLALRDKQMTEEAVLCLEEATKHHVHQGCHFRSMCTTLLMGGLRRAEALAKVQMAIRLDNGAQVSCPDSTDMNLCESVAVLAWATAANSKDEWEVGKLDREASALCDRMNKPVVAMVHYSFGRAYQELGKLNQSVPHFEKCAEAEPQGNYGRLAKAALESSTEAVSG